MGQLTWNMRNVLRGADIESGEVNDVPLGTMNGFEARGFITKAWRRAGGIRTTPSKQFPHYHGVKLTELGMRVARIAKES